MEAIVAPPGDRSIATMRVCLVSVFVVAVKVGVDRTRDLDLPAFRVVERAEAMVFDLVLVMGSSEVHATPSAAPPQPPPGQTPGRARPRSRRSHSKSPQQCSEQTRKPVNSEQDSCSLDRRFKAAISRFCCRSALKAAANNDSLRLTRSAAGTGYDGSVGAGSSTAVLFVLP